MKDFSFPPGSVRQSSERGAPGVVGGEHKHFQIYHCDLGMEGREQKNGSATEELC
jgi:hypothetical protein